MFFIWGPLGGFPRDLDFVLYFFFNLNSGVILTKKNGVFSWAFNFLCVLLLLGDASGGPDDNFDTVFFFTLFSPHT